MNLTEQKKRLEEILRRVQEICKEKYHQICLHDECFFQQENGVCFHVMKFPGEAALVVEYADTLYDAERYTLEDGDRFYLDDMTDQEIIEAVLREVEDAEPDEP